MAKISLSSLHSLPHVSDFDNLCDIYDLTHSEDHINLRVDMQDVIQAERFLTRKRSKKSLRDYLGNFDDIQ